MRKILLLTSLTALLCLPLHASPADEEVAGTLDGVFGIYASLLFVSMAGVEMPGAQMEMDMASGASSLVFDNLDTAALFALIGESLDGSGDFPPIPFSRVSGHFDADADGNLDVNLSFEGGPVSRLEMKTSGDEMVLLLADGMDYRYIGELWGSGY